MPKIATLASRIQTIDTRAAKPAFKRNGHDPRYSTRAWKAKRADQLKREPLCRKCKKQGRETIATVADHVIPHKGDDHKFWNGELQSLCTPCHSGSKAIEERHGFSTDVGKDGMPMDARHPWNQTR